jgi:hypothetical protein
MKIEPGADGYLSQWPSMCFCGSQPGPMVDTFIDKPGYGGRGPEGGRLYFCRSCGVRVARQFGLVKGDEMTRLQSAADELAQAAIEVAQRQEIIDRMTQLAGENEAKLKMQRDRVEDLEGQLALMKSKNNQIAALAAV